LLALEREAMNKLNKALTPILPEILACFKVGQSLRRLRDGVKCITSIVYLYVPFVFFQAADDAERSFTSPFVHLQQAKINTL
jgi:hypothetical protein